MCTVVKHNIQKDIWEILLWESDILRKSLWDIVLVFEPDLQNPAEMDFAMKVDVLQVV